MHKDKNGRIRFQVKKFRFYVTKDNVRIYDRTGDKEAPVSYQKLAFMKRKYVSEIKQARSMI